MSFPVGTVIDQPLWGQDVVRTTSTGIVKTNSKGKPFDEEGNVVDIKKNQGKTVGHVAQDGTFDTRYNPI